MHHSAPSPKSIAVPDQASTALCQLLNQQIVDTLDLQLQSRRAADAVKERNPQLLALFEGVARDLLESINILITRIDALGGQECGTIRIATQHTHHQPYLVEATDPRGHLHALLSSYSKYDSAARNVMKSVERMGDPITHSLLQKLNFAVERNLWLLETHLEAIVSGLQGRKLPEWTPAFEHQFRNIQRNP